MSVQAYSRCSRLHQWPYSELSWMAYANTTTARNLEPLRPGPGMDTANAQLVSSA